MQDMAWLAREQARHPSEFFLRMLKKIWSDKMRREDSHAA